MLHDNTRLAVARILGDGTRRRTRAFAELHQAPVPSLLPVLLQMPERGVSGPEVTAIGQLSVYAAVQRTPPKRVLVCPAERQDPAFRAALVSLGISVVTFEIDRIRPIVFPSLNDVLPKDG